MAVPVDASEAADDQPANNSDPADGDFHPDWNEDTETEVADALPAEEQAPSKPQELSEVEQALDEAIAAHNTRVEIHSLLRQIRTDTEMEDRIIILEMIWVVVLADGHIDAHESQLMRRLAGLLFIDDVEAGLAAKRARTRVGLAD